MSKYYSLIQSNVIDFNKLLLEKYYLLGLDESEVIILIKLNKLLSSGNKFSIGLVSKTMTMTEEAIRNKLVTLINNQFITLQLINDNEIYSLDDTYKKLANLLENEDNQEKKDSISNDIVKVVALLEKEFKKLLSPLDLEVVHKWINNDCFSYDKIYNAVLEALKLKKTSVQYVDMILNKKDPSKKEKSKEGLQDLFNQVYGKIK